MLSKNRLPVPKLLLAATAAALLALASTPSSAQDEIPGAARLAFVSGSVSIEPAGQDSWGEATPNLPLAPGDRIFTDADSRAEIQVGESFVRLGPNTDLTFTRDNPGGIGFFLAAGHIHVHEFGLWPHQPFQVHTPGANGTITDGNPAEFRAVVPSKEDKNGFFTSFSGNLEVNSDTGFDQIIPVGQTLEMVGMPGNPQVLPLEGPDQLDTWSLERDQMYSRSSSLRYVSPHIPGAYELDAGGDWQPGSPYGAVWFPHVEAGWAPYHNGHWVNHAPWGWMWVEDEPWGYAPFHYGRWVAINGRWGWIPGPREARPIFSPALVVFAGGIHFGGGGVSVWFPLGPGEPYRPWYPCPPHYVDEVNISNIMPTAIVHVQTTYVNINVTNVTYVNRTIGVTAMSHDDFAAGRSAAKVSVKIDVHLLDHVTVLDKPEPKPTAASFVGHAPARPVPAKAERPVIVESKSAPKAMQTPAKPAPKAETAPVKPEDKPAVKTTAPAMPPETKAPPKPAEKAAPPAAKPTEKPADKSATTPVKPGAKPADKDKKTDKDKEKKDEEKKPE